MKWLLSQLIFHLLSFSRESNIGCAAEGHIANSLHSNFPTLCLILWDLALFPKAAGIPLPTCLSWALGLQIGGLLLPGISFPPRALS